MGRASHWVAWQGNEDDTDEALYRQNPQLQIGLHDDEHLQMTSFWIGHNRDGPLVHLKLDHAIAITDPLLEQRWNLIQNVATVVGHSRKPLETVSY